MRAKIGWLCVMGGLSGAAFAAGPGVQATISGDVVRFEFAEAMQVWGDEAGAGRAAVAQVRGRGPLDCHWSGDRLLFCRTDAAGGLPAADRFTIDLAAGLRTRAGRMLPARTFTLESSRPTLTATVLRWEDGRPWIELQATAKPTVEAIAAVLRLTRDGRPVPLPALVPLSQPSQAPRYRLPLPEQPVGGVFTLSIVPGLKGTTGPLPGTQRAVLLRMRDREPFRLREVDCARYPAPGDAPPADAEDIPVFPRPAGPPPVVPSGGRLAIECLPGEPIELRFTRMPDVASRKRFAEALPPSVRLQAWGNAPWSYWEHRGDPELIAPAAVAYLSVDAADADHILALDAALRAAGDEALATPVRVRLRTGAYRPQIGARRSRLLLADPAAAPPWVRNAPALRFRVEAVGAEARREIVEVPATRGETTSLSAETPRTLGEGGWVRWLPRDMNPLQIAAAQFDLRGIALRREVLAWAHAWDGSGPLAGAEVELLWKPSGAEPPRAVARGVTDADGVARLTLPPDFVRPADGREDHQWLLRAVHPQAGRAVLPVGDTPYDGLMLGETATDNRVWGIADKPMYRAGETVRYRLWQRAQRGGRLRAPQAVAPLDLVLIDDARGQVILDWKATPDAEGNLAGETRLPEHLVDGTYCISVEGDAVAAGDGTCFFVGTYRPQDLWADATAEDRVLRIGDTFDVDLSAGYYSGGPAADAEITAIEARIEPLPIPVAYPDFAHYRFIDPFAGNRNDRPSLATDEATTSTGARRLDAEGRARVTVPVRVAAPGGKVPAFGRLRMNAQVRPLSREGTTSPTVQASVAAHERYVGLRLTPAWFGAREPLRLAGVVIDAEGHTIADAKIEVEIAYVRSGVDGRDGAVERLGACTLKHGVETPCTVPRTRTGTYRFIARSGDAAPATIDRVVVVDGREDADDDTTRQRRTELRLLDPPRVDAPARLTLTQPYAQADALLVLTAGDEIVHWRSLHLDRTTTALSLSIPHDGARRFQTTVYVRERGVAAEQQDGLRTPFVVAVARLDIERPEVRTPPRVEVAFDRAAAEPGQTVVLRLHNAGPRPRRLALSVADDALIALGDRWWRDMDPLGEGWLRGTLFDWRDRPFHASFGGWNTGEWRFLLPWPKALAAQQAPLAIGAEEAADALPPVTFDDPSPVDVPAGISPPKLTPVVPFVAPPPPPPVAAPPVLVIDREQIESRGLQSSGDVLFNIAASDGGALRVDAFSGVVVTGSRIPRSAEVEGTSPVLSLDRAHVDETDPDRIPATSPRIHRTEPDGHRLILNPAALAGDDNAPPVWSVPRIEGDRVLVRERFAARLRTRFADVAYWQPDLVLAPGETRTLTLVVPDNLTRWRATVWSGDADDDFERAQATLEVGLPLETRLQAPVRVFPGDVADLAAHVRLNDAKDRTVTASLSVAALAAHAERALPLPARGQDRVSLRIAPTDRDLPSPDATVRLSALALAHDAQGGDATSSAIDLASPMIETRRVQVGWLGEAPIALTLPTPPAGAVDARLQVSLLPGTDAWVHRWIGDLHAYPHRCWEQILSRAVAAAIAIERGEEARFPGARAAIAEALDNAGVFQDKSGLFHYFTESADPALEDEDGTPPRRVALTAYSVRALRLLQTLGHPVPQRALDEADAALSEAITQAEETLIDTDRDDGPAETAEQTRWQAIALALGADAADGVTALQPELLDALWSRWKDLRLPARIALTRALAEQGHPAAARALQRLGRQTQVRGDARVLRTQADDALWMSSDLREQCELIDLLRDRAGAEPATLRRALIAGLGDLFAGGIEATDTQGAAICLMALRAPPARAGTTASTSAAPSTTLDIALGDAQARLSLTPGATSTSSAPPVWTQPLVPSAAQTLRLRPTVQGGDPASFVAELQYREDARRAQSNATGFALQRDYAVLRGGAWAPVDATALRDGDWVRITLTLDTAAPRHFVAITDAVPGGLRPTDLVLGGLAGLDLKAVSDTGSFWFATRRLDPRAPKFYAETLPAGRHQVHYFARVGNTGDYLAPPAVAELMYGAGSRARTAARRLRIEATPDAAR
jgi:uncharacterized protein YfaS (alpha-2-macroglobulin family)